MPASGIRLVKTKVPAATFALVDSETQLPFPDESFDICFCTEVLNISSMLGGSSVKCTASSQRTVCFAHCPYHGWIKN